MTDSTENPQSSVIPPEPYQELAALQKEWRWFVILGLGLVVLGIVAFGSCRYVSEVTVVLFGVLLLAGGMAQVIMAFWAGRWSGFLAHVFVGILYIVVGFLVVDAPKDAAATLTLLIAAFLIVGGIFRIAAALTTKFDGWGWVLLNGGVTLLMGVLIYRQWPASGEWVIGLFVGIEMLFNGWSWIMLGTGLKTLSELETDEAIE